MQFARRELEAFLFDGDRLEKNFQVKEFVDERAATTCQHNCLILFSQIVDREDNRDFFVRRCEVQVSITRDEDSTHGGRKYLPLQPITTRPYTRNPYRGVDDAL